MRYSRCCWLLALAACLGCDAAPDAASGRVAFSLTGTFFPGELTSMDLFIYEGVEVECSADDGSLSTMPSSSVDSLTGVTLDEPQEISFVLDTGVEYVVWARAGRREDSSSLDIVAQGCTTVLLERQTEVTLELHRVDSCGDGDVDPEEMCDDGNSEGGDGCDAQCRTEPWWVNNQSDFRAERQYSPVAAGDGGVLPVCWLSDNLRSQMGPMAWFDELGHDGDPFLVGPDWIRRDCTAVDVRGATIAISYTMGDGAYNTRDNVISVWLGQQALEPVEVGVSADPHIEVALLGERELVVLSQTTSGFMLRTGSISDTEVIINDTTTPVDDSARTQLSPSMAAGTGAFVVVWEDGADVLARFFDSSLDGGTVLDLCEGASSCEAPAVASLRGGNGDQFLVVYQGSEDQIMGRFIDMLGNASAEFAVSAEANGREPVVAPLNASRHEFLVAWTQALHAHDPYPARVYARVVRGVDEFGQLALGGAVTSEPMQVSPDTDSDHDQAAIATSFGTTASSTAIVFYRDIEGINESSAWDIGARLLRVARLPTDS